MVASGSADTVLKILSGVQSGVDIVLADGDYVLGSGSDDDIQLFDVSLSPAHLRIMIRQGKIEIAGGTGAVKTGNGFALEPGGDLQEIEPLDIVTAGTSRFALGPTTANWSSIVDVGGLSPSQPKTSPRPNGLDELAMLFSGSGRKALLPVGAAVVLAMAVLATSYSFSWDKGPEEHKIVRTDLELVDASLSNYAFVNRLETRQEIDGTVFVSGYVTSPVERRAALSSIRDTGVPAKVRISVTELIQNEISNFLDSENADLSFALSDNGVVTLDGVMIDADRLHQVTDKLQERVMGVASITSNVRTGPSLLLDVQALAERSQIVPLVLLRRDNDLIEASGVIPTDKIDAWAGFLQAYSTQLAPIIPLRSLVFLQDPSQPDGIASTGSDKALYLGPSGGLGNDVSVDVNRLKAGSFDLSDIFVGQPRLAPAGTVPALAMPAPDPVAAAPRFDGRPTIENARAGVIDLKAILGEDRPSAPLRTLQPKASVRVVGPAAIAAPGTAGPPLRIAAAAGSGEDDRIRDLLVQENALHAFDNEASTDLPPRAEEGVFSNDEMARMAKRLIENGGSDTLTESENGAALQSGIRALEEAHPGGGAVAKTSLPTRYGRMLASLRSPQAEGRLCWQGSRLTTSNALGTLFWLDLLSVTDQLSLSRFSAQFQELMIEAALNPDMTGRCVEQADGIRPSSVYLHEVSKNPDFVRHILRDTEPYVLDVSGVSLTDDRYIQIRSGAKYRQGGAPDEGSRILTVGELGLALERQSGYASVIFNDQLNWFTR